MGLAVDTPGDSSAVVVFSNFSDFAVDYGTNDAVFAVIVFGLCLTVVGPRMQMDCFGNMMLFSGGFFKKTPCSLPILVQYCNRSEGSSVRKI